MNNFSINYDFNPSDSSAMDELRKEHYAKEQNMEAVKFKEFHFFIPYNDPTLMDIANFVATKAATFKNKVAANDENFKEENLIQKRLKEFRRLTGTIEVDEIPSNEERKEARINRYVK